MKKLLLFTLLIYLVNFSLSAQDMNSKNVNPTQSKAFHQEAGILFNNISDAVALRNFGLIYRVGNASSMWRFNALNLNFTNQSNSREGRIDNFQHFSITLKAGKEFRKPVLKNMELRYGADLSFGYSYQNQTVEMIDTNIKDEMVDRIFSPGVNAVLGVNYVVNDKLVIGAEILPTFEYNARKHYFPSDNTNGSWRSTSYNMHLGSGLMHISCAIRF